MAATVYEDLPDAWDPFVAWTRASAALRQAEASAADYAELVHLSEDVIRARVLLTVDRIDAGWQPPPSVVVTMSMDEMLLSQVDDRDPALGPR